MGSDHDLRKALKGDTFIKKMSKRFSGIGKSPSKSPDRRSARGLHDDAPPGISTIEQDTETVNKVGEGSRDVIYY